MALKVINRIVESVFYTEKKQVLVSTSLQIAYFDYACLAWYPNLNKRLKSKFQMLQNKCMRFCLNLNNRAQIGQN